MNKEDIVTRATPVYSSEQVDQLILTPEGKATVLIRKKPNWVKQPIYLLNEDGEKIPVRKDGEVVLNENNEIQYIIKDYEYVQDGWIAVEEILPASEPFTIDNSTGNLSQEAVNFSIRTMWFYNYLMPFQTETNEDYSLYLHKLRNDFLAVTNTSKSFRQGTIQSIKTFRNIVDTKEWSNREDEEQKNAGLFGWLLGGNKKKSSKPPDEHKSAFSKDYL